MRRRILLLVVGMTTLVVLAFAVPLMFLTRSSIAKRTESDVVQQAFSLANTISATEPTGAQLRSLVKRVSQDGGHPVSVTLPNGTVIGKTPDDDNGRPTAAGPPPTAPPGSDQPHPEPDHDAPPQLVHTSDGQVALALASSPDGRYIVRVFLDDDARVAGVTGWYTLIIAASVGLIALGIIGGEVLTRRITRPLLRTAETAQRLSTGDVTARAPTDGPGEVAEVGVALNRLADRIDELITEERETVADLSHRLRTPLTSLRLDAEALRDPGEAERIGSRVNELERMLTAVIRAARRPQREGRLPVCDATDVVRRRVEFWSALSEEQGRRVTTTLPSAPLPVRASGEDLAATVDALVENVIAHTTEGVDYAVTLQPTAGGARLEIADDGPGIPEAAEVRGRSDRGSSGLGLDIARRCAEAAGGSMSIGTSASGGALVTVLLHGP